MVEKRVLLLFSKASAQKGNADPEYLARLITEGGADIAVSYACFEDLLFYLDETQSDVIDTTNMRSLAAYSAVYFRYWGDAAVQGAALAAARYCKLKHIPFIDSEVLRPGSFNKITQYMNLHEAGVPFPKTLIASASQLIARYKEYGFEFPLVLKSTAGTRGRDNYMVRSEDEMRTVLRENSNLSFVLQTFLPNQGDYRVLVMGDSVVMAIKRTSTSGTHVNNTSQGGAAAIVPVDSLPQEVRDSAIHAARFFGRQVAGVDMVRCTADGRWYCFEVNRAPQIEHASFEREKAAVLNAYLRTIVK